MGKHAKPEEIVAKLRQFEVLTAQSKSIAEAARLIGVSEQTYYRWRADYGSMKMDQVRRLKELETENARLRRAVSDLTLDKLKLWWQDEARIGQQGTLTRIWARRGSRPPTPRNQRYTWAYLFGAVCPVRGVGAGLVLPYANAAMMNLHLAEIGAAVAPGAHAVLTIDGAGWHQTGDKLIVPPNITLLHLPPYSPELNPVETAWAYLRGNKLSNRVFETYDDIVDACCDAWKWLTAQPERITSIATRSWATVSA